MRGKLIVVEVPNETVAATRAIVGLDCDLVLIPNELPGGYLITGIGCRKESPSEGLQVFVRDTIVAQAIPVDDGKFDWFACDQPLDTVREILDGHYSVRWKVLDSTGALTG